MAEGKVEAKEADTERKVFIEEFEEGCNGVKLVFYNPKTKQTRTKVLQSDITEAEKEILKEQLHNLSVAIGKYYLGKKDSETAFKAFKARPDYLESIALDEPNEVIALSAQEAYLYSSALAGITPKSRKYFELKRPKFEQEESEKLETKVERVEKVKAVEQVKPVVEKKIEKVVKVIEKPKHITEPKILAPKRQVIKQPTKLIPFLSPALSFKNVIPAAASAFVLFTGLYGMAYLNLKAANKRTAETQQNCQDLITINHIKSVTKDNLEGKTFYIPNAEESWVGNCNLLKLINYNGNNKKIKDFLESIVFKIEKEAQLYPPLDSCRLRDEFGATGRKVGGEWLPIHTGGDYNGGDSIRAMAYGKVTVISWDHISGSFVKIDYGKAQVVDNGLEVTLINGDKFRLNGDSLRGIGLKENKKGWLVETVVNKSIKRFDKKPVSAISCHCSKILVKPGQYVKGNQAIAIKGRTGRATSRHLHYIFKIGEEYMDPEHIILKSQVPAGDSKKLYTIKDSTMKILGCNYNF